MTINSYSLKSWNWDQVEIGTESGRVRIGHDCVVTLHDAKTLHDAYTNDDMTVITDDTNT